ncbi:tyrosine-type recombinase/integrase [Psychrobacter arenosus]|uniref:tyrosine-type recombinase/integrase n=1 Tax=Psychrobacter arenosus TaxID=256326 RepID=UPI00191AFF27|nr:tyrosine-type recombinase/integrase [Psychrobacter arenosus]
MAKLVNGITTDSQIKKAIKQAILSDKPALHPIAGYKGLEIRIRPTLNGTDATTDFRHRYTHPYTGKRPYMTLGQYPALSIADARQMHSDNMQLLARGIDPIENRDAKKQQEIADRNNTLNYFIDEWLEIQAVRNLSQSSYRNNAFLIRPIREQLGNIAVVDIRPSTVIQFIRDIQKTNPKKGLSVKSVLRRILQIAKANMVIEHNPASDLEGILVTHKPTHRPALSKDPVKFAKLLNEIDQLADDKNFYNKRILQLLALTFVRIGDACAMRWKDINFNNKTWELEQQKGSGRQDMAASLVVPLAPQAIAILKEMHELTGGHEYVFYNARRKKANYHNPREINSVLNSELMNDGKGYLGIHSPHGFRSAAKTMLSERLGYDEVLTELQLGHKMLNKYGNAYNRMEALDSRIAMMTDWANYLDKLRDGEFNNVIYPQFRQKQTKQA